MGADDLLRPLTEEGIKKARNGFSVLAKFYQKPDIILSSQAVRAVATAALLKEAFGEGVQTESTHLLNPGADLDDFKEVLKSRYSDNGCVAIVGHEPDFSLIVSGLISEEEVMMDIKKASAIEVEIDENFHGSLAFMIPPKFLTFLKKASKQ